MSILAKKKKISLPDDGGSPTAVAEPPRNRPMKKITIDHVTRIEGHAKIDIYLDDQGHVSDTHFHVTQVRGFEKFTEGRPFYEMPSITARICGICPVSRSEERREGKERRSRWPPD